MAHCRGLLRHDDVRTVQAQQNGLMITVLRRIVRVLWQAVRAQRPTDCIVMQLDSHRPTAIHPHAQWADDDKDAPQYDYPRFKRD
jgi:hypothetical protein